MMSKTNDRQTRRIVIRGYVIKRRDNESIKIS